ncbi:MAG TPA: radical SAM protein [Armatimonadota bacterium]|jgi:radical SAM superfamily enzyme YgiQ (UPF0313 family)
MKILLLHPPIDHELPPYYWSESLGIGYLASSLRLDGHDVDVFDAQIMGLKPEEMLAQLLKRDFDCLGISATHDHKSVLMSTVRAVRKARKDAIITAGGYLPTLSADKLFDILPELDFVVRGEGETSVRDVFGRIARSERWQDAQGVAFLQDGKTVCNPVPPTIRDLDSLPFPARDALASSPRKAWARIAGSRGCYHRCSFCCIRKFYDESGAGAPRFRSAENVVDEMEQVIAQTGVREFRFIDDDFIGPGEKNRQRVLRFAQQLEERKLNATFAIECRADEIHEDLLKSLKEVGLIEVFVGLESAVQRQLDTYNKRVTVEQNRNAIEAVRRCGINLRSGFIAFDPYVTIPELIKNMMFISETKIDDESTKIAEVPMITKVKLYPGVPLIETVRKDGLLQENGIEVDYKFKHLSVRLLTAISRALIWAKTRGRSN